MSHCISIRNYHRFMPPLDGAVSSAFKEILHLEFHDVESRDWLPPNSERIPIPEKDDIVHTMRFFNSVVKDPGLTGFTIHCWRGISRSSAIAAGIIYMVLNDEARTVNYLRSIRPKALPLPRIIRFWDEVLGSDLSRHTDAIRAGTFKEMKRQFLEDICDDDLLEELPVVD